MNIGILGIGRLGFHLSNALEMSGHTVCRITTHDTDEVCLQLKSNACELLFLCVQDSNIEVLATKLKLDITVAHVSGSVSIDSISAISKHYGVFYCLQTFSKEDKIDFKQIPILIEASDSDTSSLLEFVGKSLSNCVKLVSSEQRLYLHAAAVFACNYTNLMYTVASDILEFKNLEFDLLAPLIFKTAEKAFLIEPSKAQTGPALRSDEKTLEKHHNLLLNLPTLPTPVPVLAVPASASASASVPTSATVLATASVPVPASASVSASASASVSVSVSSQNEKAETAVVSGNELAKLYDILSDFLKKRHGKL